MRRTRAPLVAKGPPSMETVHVVCPAYAAAGGQPEWEPGGFGLAPAGYHYSVTPCLWLLWANSLFCWVDCVSTLGGHEDLENHKLQLQVVG